jgi:hypothetical protein
MMLGAPPLEGDPERPPYPRALALNREVKAHLQLQRGTPRSHGFHPSEMPYLCPVLFYYAEEARTDLLSNDPMKVAAAFEFIRKMVDAKDQKFGPGLKMEFRVGDAIHAEVQYRLGVLGRLWGRWKCAQCHVTFGPNWMPRIWERDIQGGVIALPAPCVHCHGANRRSRVPWVYLEPRVESKEWGIVGHADGDLRILQNGWWYRYILEIKSINQAGFEGKRGPLPEERHIAQASLYGWLMGVDYIQFIYVCKNQVNRWKEFIVPVDYTSVNAAVDKIRAVLKGQAEGRAPLESRICPSVQDEQAKTCPAVERCFGCKPATSFWEE